MSEDLHNMDEFFKTAYKQFSDDPSPDVWKKINAGLDKKDADAYKRRSKRWKQVAIFSLLLLSGYVLYETNVLRTGFNHSDKNTPAVVKTDRPKENKDQNEKAIIPKQSLSSEQNSNAQESNNNPVAKGNKINSDVQNAFDHSTSLLHNTNKTRTATNDIEKTMPGDNTKETAAIRSGSGNSEKGLLKPTPYSLAVDIIPPSVEATYPNGVITGQLSYIPSTTLNRVTGLSSKSEVKSNNPLEDRTQWAVSGFVSSDRAGYRLDKDQPTIVNIKAHEDHLPSFSAGVLLTRKINRRFALQTGVIYSDISIDISPQKIYASQNQTGNVLYKYVTSSGNAYIKPDFASSPYPGDSLQTENTQHNLQYVITPLVVKYKLINSKKLVLSPGLGIAGNFLTSAKIETEVEGIANREHVVINKLEGIRNFNWSLMADASLDYLMNKRVSLNLRAFFSYALSPISSTDNVETFPYSFGVGVGSTYRF